MDDHGISARHRGVKHGTDIDYEYLEVSDDGCCGGGQRNSRAKRKGKRTHQKKNGKRESGKEDFNQNRLAKDDGFGKVNEAITDSEDEKEKANKV